MKKMIGALLMSVLMASPVMAETEEDPWEGFNRAMFTFNDTLDSNILKPVAQGYQSVTPAPVQKGVSNFFSNIGEVGNFTNNLLQGNWNGTASSFFRFLINSTAGWFGIFDVASELGLQEYDEDFGQTLGVWGVSSGPYLVLPFFGPSTIRDTGGLVVDYANYDVTDEFDLEQEERWGLRGLDVVETRARLLSVEGLVFGDRYTFVRDVYLQTRTNEIYNGNLPEELQDDDSWGDDDWDDDWENEEWDDEALEQEEAIETAL
ncbi:MlaA family lipoprotein [Marinomonas epiphytica]